MQFMHIYIKTLASKYIQWCIITNLITVFLLNSTTAYPKQPEHPWYIGREACMPIFFGNLRTYLQEQHPISLQYGLSGGYQLHRFFGLELSVDYGNSRLTSRPADHTYSLDKYGQTYSTPQIPGTIPYTTIYSLLKYAGLGIHIPFNLNHLFFHQSKAERLTLFLSPHCSVNRYKSKIRLKHFHQSWLSPQVHWSFDLGADLLLRYTISNRIDFQLRSGIKYISNKKFDGLSISFPHNTSYVWSSGISLLYKFGKKLPFAVIKTKTVTSDFP